jgi:hypothetical protein
MRKSLVMLVVSGLLAGCNDVTRDLARCELEAERLYPTPSKNGTDEAFSIYHRQGSYTQTCMRAAGYKFSGPGCYHEAGFSDVPHEYLLQMSERCYR